MLRLSMWLGLAWLALASGVQVSLLQSAELSPSDTRVTVQALLAGGLAQRVQQHAGDQQLQASKLELIAQKRAKSAKKAKVEAVRKQREYEAANKAEEANGAGLLLVVSQERGQQSIQEAKEAALKHELWTLLKAQQEKVSRIERARLEQGQSLEAQMNQAAAHAQQTKTAHAQLSTKLQGATQSEIASKAQLENATHSAARASQLATETAVEKEALTSELEKPASLPKEISTEDIWGLKKCESWLSKDPTKCKAPNYKFNCAKTCAGLDEKAPKATPEKLAAASSKLSGAVATSQRSDAELAAQQHDHARVKHASKAVRQDEAVSAVAETRAKQQMENLVNKAHSVTKAIAEASVARLELKTLCQVLESATKATANSLRAKLTITNSSKSEGSVVEAKALKVGLMLLGDDGTAPHNNQSADFYLEALKKVQASSLNIRNQTSNKLLRQAHQIVHRAADSVTALLAAPSILTPSPVTPEEAERIQTLKQDAQKALATATLQQERAKQAEAQARSSERQALRLKQKTWSVINDQVLIDSFKHKHRPSVTPVEESVKEILESP